MNQQKSSIFSWFGFVQPLPERLKMIRQAGFSGVSLWWEDETYPALIPVDEMPSMVREAGLIFENMHTPYQDVNDLWVKNQELRLSTVNRYRHYLQQCNQHEIPVLVMHATDLGGPQKLSQEGLDSFSILSRSAEEYGVRIAVENTRDAKLVDALLEELAGDWFGLCYDSSHDWLEGQTKGDLLEKWIHRVYTTHLSDNDMTKDCHWIPGDGKVDWSRISFLLSQSNLNFYSMELLGSIQPVDQPHDFLGRAIGKWSDLVVRP